jgi:Lipase
MIGKNVKTGKVQVIHGLDPAGPLFYFDKPEDRLAKTDA